MRLAILFLTLAFSAPFVSAKETPSLQTSNVSPAAVLREINLARENPTFYATLVAESRPFHMVEGGRVVDEAVRFLKRTRPLAPLALSAGMCCAAADNCAEQSGEQLGHLGTDHSSLGDRINRYGAWSGTCGENISYGQRTARGIVLTLIIDHGVRSRGHRQNIFNAKFDFTGAAYGPHAVTGRFAASISPPVMLSAAKRW
jgi:uncharacterized protein YkwD